MNSIGLKLILDMGCICSKEIIVINGSRYKVLERIAEGMESRKHNSICLLCYNFH